jgi:hypothetical protein
VALGQLVQRDVSAQAMGSVRVRAREESGAPVAGVLLDFVAADEAWGTPDSSTPPKTDADGLYVLPAAPPGSVRVSTRATERYAPSGSILLEVPPGGSAEAEIIVPLAPPTPRPRR